MKILNIILSLVISLSVFAQRDFQLAVDRNVWLSKDNAAGYTTFSDSTMSRGMIDYKYNYKGINSVLGSKSNIFDIETESYMHLSPTVVAYGKASYKNNSISDAGGSTIYGNEMLQPFDIIENVFTEDGQHTTIGDRSLQMFQFIGIAGWNVTKGLSIGAMFDFNAGSYVKQKDLRHTNSLMSLDTRFSVMQRFTKRFALGASFIYKRNTETIQYKTYGTSDLSYSVFVDYASGIGFKEVFGENGFTDSRYEQPLINDNFGTNVQFHVKPFKNDTELLLGFNYLHRNGYYGKESQFTVSYANHSGNSYLWKARLNFPSTAKNFTMVEGNLAFYDLTSYSTNYRQTRDANNNSISRYEYFTPTKISDKYLMTGNIIVKSYFGIWESGKDRPSIYPWLVQGGVDFTRNKQTGYIGLDNNTIDCSFWIPSLLVKRNIRMRKSDVLGIEMGSNYIVPVCNDYVKDGVTAHTTVSYEIPLKAYPNIRPTLSLTYQYSEISYRQHVMVSIGANF